MNTTGSRLSDYYKSIRLNPVGHDISREDRMRLHERKRQNLLERHLKLPGYGWRGARVLEFGPGSGENAVALARLGARLTFVEPLDYLSDRLKATFAEFGLSRSIEAVHTGVLEKFSTAERYDVVFAEGFLHFLEDHGAAVRKLLSFANDEGFVIVSDLDQAGTFIEFVKRCYLEYACAALGLRSAEERLEMARGLYGPEFAKINHSRGFESWAQDCVLNPLYRPKYFLGFPEILAAAPAGVVPYSTWPNYLDHDDLVWHKNILDEKTYRDRALRSYYSRAPHFLHSVPPADGRALPVDPARGRAFIAAIEACYAALDRAVSAADPRSSSYERPLARLHAAAGSAVPADTKKVLDASRALFRKTPDAPTRKSLIDAWRRSALLRRLWGSPGHYVVLHKTALHGSRKP